MNIFFTASIRGGRAAQPQYEKIVRALEKYGTVTSRHVSDDTLSEHGETSLSARDIFERERESLGKSDVVVAEVTTPSLGVGYLIAYATSLNKKVIALYNGDGTFKVSAMVKGDPSVKVYTYKGTGDLPVILDQALPL